MTTPAISRRQFAKQSGLLVVGLVLHVMVGAVKAGLQRRAAASAGVPD